MWQPFPGPQWLLGPSAWSSQGTRGGQGGWRGFRGSGWDLGGLRTPEPGALSPSTERSQKPAARLLRGEEGIPVSVEAAR